MNAVVGPCIRNGNLGDLSSDPSPGFSSYSEIFWMGEAEFLGVKILNFVIKTGFSENINIWYFGG